MSSAPLIVVGAGIAGLSVALAAAPRPVLLLSAGANGDDSSTRLAQGGIAAAIAPGDHWLEHCEDTLRCGSYSNDVEAVRYLTQQAPSAIAWLQRLGADFDGDRHGLHFAREGGHRRARVLHLGGDASGAGLLRVLQEAARAAAHIAWREGVCVEGLLRRGERVSGVVVRDGDDYRSRIHGSAVVLATGGIGGLFAATSNPASSQGVGLALARAVGARLRDLELLQFHPTGLATTVAGPQRPLLTEALRGAGAVLRDEHGQALMAGVHPQGDLAPRDIVARRIWQRQQAGDRVFLDVRHIGERVLHGFPTVAALCAKAGIDPVSALLPVTPLAHFHMGGIAVDLDGASSAPGLFAVGEVAGNGVHGGNRLASNALLEAVVFGRRLGQRLRDEVQASASAMSTELSMLPPPATMADLEGLRGLLWKGMGPVRTHCGLQLAIERVATHPELCNSWQGRLALCLLHAALARRENCGAHYRADAIGPRAQVAGDAASAMPVSPCQ
ncbi:MAG TPA: FAD-binding protein [Arenimonas sp.]|nr:FAD-binding protein [Arenimonas sp.]